MAKRNNTEMAPPSGEQVIIRGKVAGANGLPLVKAKVQAFSPILGNLKEEGTAYTDEQGNYSLSVSKDLAWVNLAVGNEDQNPLLKSGLLRPADLKGNYNFAIGSQTNQGVATEFAYIDQQLRNQGVTTVKDLEENDDRADIALLAQATGLQEAQLALFILAHRHGANTRTQINPELFYGLFRQGYLAEVDVLLNAPNKTLEARLKTAQENKIIGSEAWNGNTADQVINHQMLRTEANAFSSIDEFLGIAFNDQAIRLSIGRHYDQYGNDKAAFWKNLPANINAQQLKVMEELSPMLLRNAGLAERLVSINGSLPNQASDFLRLPDYELYTETGWQALLSNQSSFPEIIRGANPTEKRQNYAQYLANYVRATYPMQVLAEKINRGEIGLKNSNTQSEIYDFLHNNTGFDLATSKVNDPKIDLSPDAVLELQRLQTLNRLAKDEAMLATLQQHGADNALHIVRTRGGDLGSVLSPTDQKQLLTRAEDHVAAQALSIALHGRDTNSEPVAGIKGFLGNKSLDYCEVKDCESLHGAAAYFVDLLDFMGGDQDAGAERARPFETFSQRRPDLLELELSCANTDTPMPYIDVVNEILEYKVAHSHLSGDAVHNTPININQTEKAQLLTAPQHVNTAAYDRLKTSQAVYPLHLPFNYAWEAARAYLGKAGVSYYEILSKTKANQPWSTDWPEELWLEYLGISPEEWTHVFIPLQFETTNLDAYFGGKDFSKRENVNTFLDLFQLRFDELEAIVRGDFFARNPNPIALYFTGNENNLCQADHYKIAYQDGVSLNHQDWSRLYYFIRVWKKLGWSIEHTNTWLFLLLSSTARTFGRALHDLAWVKRVADYFKISDERGMEVLLDLVKGGNAENVFARLLNISAKELRDYLLIIDPDNYETFLSAPGFPQIWYYSHCIQAIKSSGFEVAELAYLYRHTYTSDSVWAESEKAILKKMEDLNTGLLAVEKSIDTSGAISNLELIRVNFGPYFEGDTLSKFLAALADPDAILERDLATTIIKPFVSEASLFDYVDKFMDHPRSDQAQWLVDIIFPNIIAEKRNAFIAETLSAQLGLQGNVTKALLNYSNLLQSVTDPSQAMIADFNLHIADFPNINQETVHSFQKAYVRLRKAAVLCNKFKILEDELSYLAGAERDGFNGLPTETLAEGTVGLTFENHWFPWYRYIQLREKWTKGKASLMFILRAWDVSQGEINTREWLQVESETWSSVMELTGLLGSTFETNNVLEMVLLAKLEHVHELMLLNREHDLDIYKIGVWTSDRSNLDQSILDEIKDYFNKRFDSITSLNQSVKEVEDMLRKRRRDALVAYLIQQNAVIETPSDLYTQLLIDVEMESCMKISRLKLAISSAQLFIQRCLLGLESGIDSTTLDGKRWKWMKNFRVWEANRKIFLYPENWLDPEFRHNQTELFKEAESQLMQGDMSDEQVKQVFADYIHNFEPIAKLQPKALFTEKTHDNSIVHVIGRTFAQPSKHYYRKWDRSHNAWSAWTKIPIEMDGDHLMPVVWQDSLYIFWVTFMEKGENDPLNTEDYGGPKTIKKVEISISYTEYRGGKWLPRKTVRQLNKKDYYIKKDVNSEEYAFKPENVVTKIIPTDTSLKILIGLKHEINSKSYREYNSISIEMKERNQDTSPDSGIAEIKGNLLSDEIDNLSFNNEIIGSTTISVDSRGSDYYRNLGERYLMYSTKKHSYFAFIETKEGYLPQVSITPLDPVVTAQIPDGFDGGFTDPLPLLTNQLIKINFGGLEKTIQLSSGTLFFQF